MLAARIYIAQVPVQPCQATVRNFFQNTRRIESNNLKQVDLCLPVLYMECVLLKQVELCREETAPRFSKATNLHANSLASASPFISSSILLNFATTNCYYELRLLNRAKCGDPRARSPASRCRRRRGRLRRDRTSPSLRIPRS